ncbi:hypothetical protein [Pseudoduganella sp. OTU4001]|uniref:hypothetical protein n=1 Tax=Pseudoduganella sp. OTU4001 TaxID=3043854 RepID=UPI00313CD16D
MTISLLLAAALGAVPPAEADPVWQCTAAHYRGFVSPSGARAHWPTVAKLPAHLRDTRHILLSTPGIAPGGRAHMMFIDSAAKVVYIVQTSGPADTEVVFGPLPPVDCPKG